MKLMTVTIRSFPHSASKSQGKDFRILPAPWILLGHYARRRTTFPGCNAPTPTDPADLKTEATLY